MDWSDLRARFGFLDLLEAHFEAVRAELLALDDVGWMDMPSTGTYQGSWRVFALRLGSWEHEYPGVDMAANRARCPRTCELVDRLSAWGEVPIAGFLSLEEGTVIGMHSDFRADNEVRCHLGLVMPPGEAWPEGTARLLDIRMPHAARNPGPGPRMTLMVDVRLPFELPTGVLPAWGRPGVTPPG